MDITANQLKNMKAKQLRKIIQEAIDEVLAEATQKTTIDYKNPSQPDKVLDIDPSDVPTINKLKTDSNVSSITMGTKKIKEGNIDEMANIGKLFQLDPDVDISTLTGKKSRIAAAMQAADGPVSQANVAKALGYTKVTSKGETVGHQNPIDKDFREMGAAGIIVPAGTQIAQRFNRPEPTPGEEDDDVETGPKATDAEDLFIGGADPLSMYFDGEPNADGTEDFNNEEEPTVGDVEPSEPTTKGGMSDADYEAFMKYGELKDRLNATKSNLLKMKRNKGGTPGDISDRPSTEEQRLRDLKKSLEDRINTLVQSSDYLKKKVEKETGKPVEPIETPEEEEEEPIDEAFDAAYEKRKIQFYAGIIK